MKKTFICLLVSLVIINLMGLAWGVEGKENSHLWKTRVTSATVFKNGMGFFMRQGDVALHDGWCVSDAVPPAAFGTLAIFSHGENETVDLIGSGPGEIVEFDGIDAPKDAITKRQRLETCKFLKVQLTYTQRDADRTAAGQLVSVADEYVVLETEGNDFAVPLAGIKKLQVLEKPLRVHVASDNNKKPAAKTTLGMAYLRKGITWIPEYTLKLLDDETAELTLRGTLVNEAEDLVHAEVNFVVGVPHFLHTDYLAPIAVGQVIRTIGTAVAPPAVMNQVMNRAAIANDIGAAYTGVIERPTGGSAGDLGAALGNLPQWEGSGATDFAVYTRKDLSVRCGEKAIVTLFVKRIKYGHSYHWSPPGDIAHSLTMQNDTDTAWTTGPCLVVSDNNALSEDLLKYVPKGGKGEFPLATAVNITHDKKETEANRELKAYQPSQNYFMDLVTLAGTVKLHNYGKTPAELMVDLPLPGKPIGASDDGEITLNAENLKLLERTGNIRWHLTLKPGEERTLSYKYERYVPSQ
jgi:hypothetical protein